MAFSLYFELAPARRGSDDGRGSSRRLAAAFDDVGASLPQDHPDGPVVEALRSGDMQVFETIYAAHANALYGFAQAYVGPDLAHDIVQDVFLALWRRRTTVSIGRGLRAYLFGATRLRALQYRRNAQTSETHNSRLAFDDNSPSTVDPAEHAELREAVARALMTLPGRTRELLALRWVYSMSYTEAAAILGVSAEAAKKLGRRAEVALAPLLERFRE